MCSGTANTTYPPERSLSPPDVEQIEFCDMTREERRAALPNMTRADLIAELMACVEANDEFRALWARLEKVKPGVLAK